jgi:hypothetical protein
MPWKSTHHKSDQQVTLGGGSFVEMVVRVDSVSSIIRRPTGSARVTVECDQEVPPGHEVL